MNNTLFFLVMLLTLLYFLDVLCFFNKKQPIILDKKWVILLMTLFVSGLWTIVYMKTNQNIIKIDTNIQDFDSNGVHDSTCQCGYCMEPQADYYLNLGIMDTTGDFNIYLIDPISNDTVANLSHMDSLKKIIEYDNI